MSTPEEEISQLKAKIERYEDGFNAAITSDDKKMYADLITETRKTLNILLQQQLQAQAGGGQGGRPSTPGDSDSVFGLIELTVTKKRKITTLTATPCGSAFAISNQYVITARHNLLYADGHEKEVGLVKEIVEGVPLHETGIIKLVLVADSVENDWAVLRRDDGEAFPKYATVCPDVELPSESSTVGVKDFTAGMFEVGSSTKLKVLSVSTKVCQYEPRASDNMNDSSMMHIPVIRIGEPMPPVDSRIEDTIMVSGGRVYGSCGGPYFAENGKVVAFHVRSLDDAPEPSGRSTRSHSSNRSHVSYSHGYVLCRLPDFVQWHNDNIGPL